ncbi:MAG TPA: cupin domain-containing protein [Cyclobacteriaceae bacterium]|nr:cupin domain-containing protein [Cyclobacteriaceae bacterium]
MKRRQFISATVTGILVGEGLSIDAAGQEIKSKAITNKVAQKPLKEIYVKPSGQDFTSGAKIRFEDTNNQLSTWERVLRPRTMGPAPHLHKDLDEIMRVMKGKVAVLVGDQVTYVEEGAWHLRPHGVVHTFWNESDEPATVLEIYPNQNFEVYLEEINQILGQLRKNGIKPDSQEGINLIDKLDKEWGVVTFHDQREGIRKKYGLK